MRADIENAMALLRSQDPAQLDRVLQLLQNTVFSFSMRVCGHREDAEDTAQEVLAKVLPYLHQFENEKALTAWLYTVARNRCWMSRRRSKFAPAQHLSLDELMPDAGELERLMTGGHSPERSVLLAEDKQLLEQAILRIPPQYRLVLVLHDVEELTTEEIAKVLGITEGNVRVRLHRARLFVRRELSREAKAAKTAKTAEGPAPVRRSARCRWIFSNLSNYMDGVLDESLCHELELHLKGCEPCQAFLKDLTNTVKALRDMPAELPDPHTASQARARALAKPERQDARS
jgi:RNA polymerase sigma-70 factor (ECF subfamily)